MEEKRFDKWITLKEKLHNNGNLPRINEREIWWCSCGENVGVEINGKSNRFTRPVLIYRKFSRYGFMGIPLTSKKHDDYWHVEFDFLGKNEWAVICQARVMSCSRLHSKMGQVSPADFQKIKDSFIEIYS